MLKLSYSHCVTWAKLLNISKSQLILGAGGKALENCLVLDSELVLTTS